MIPTKGICVDGSCLGNPGKGEYRGINLETKEVVFEGKSKLFSYTTNNIMEFCGIVHALKYRKENNLDVPVYSDSEIAIAWVNKKQVGTTLVKDTRTEKMYEFINTCERWLLENTKNSIPLNKWVTKEWGEIPADFGNKDKPNKMTMADVVSKSSLKNWIEEEKRKDFIGQYIILDKLIKDFSL